jgi:hypothetical protein
MASKRKSQAGYRLDGTRVYKVKGATPSKRTTYKTKTTALRALKVRGKRKHKK